MVTEVKLYALGKIVRICLGELNSRFKLDKMANCQIMANRVENNIHQMNYILAFLSIKHILI